MEPFDLLTSFKTVATLLFGLMLAVSAQAVRCFCDKRNCEDALMCTGQWCLVGFKSDVRLDQMCGTDNGHDLLDCAENWNGWVEVCACREDFCNTFAYLRHQMERARDSRKKSGQSVYSGGTDDQGNPLNPEVGDFENPRPPQYQSNQLIILLVVIPLAVGASAVCLVFVNYHCRMC